MATEIDHDDIKTQIETILEANSTLYDATGGASPAKVRVIEVGPPKMLNGEIIDTTLPHIWITNSSGPFETIRNNGVLTANVVKALEHTFHYDIIIIVDSKDQEFSEEDLDDFQKLTLETLEANVDLSAKVDISFPIRVDNFPHSGIQIGGKQGRKITLRCIKTTT